MIVRRFGDIFEGSRHGGIRSRHRHSGRSGHRRDGSSRPPGRCGRLRRAHRRHRGRIEGGRELDASGQVVAPGFIDIHTHYDAQVFWDPWLTPSSFHGVTSVIAGNCGFSIAPIRPDGVGLLARTLQHVEDMSFDTLAAGVPWDEFETFPQYLDAVEGGGVSLNYGCYVGHTAVRLFVMGDDAYERPATAGGDHVACRRSWRESMAAGAMGFASSASPTHNGDGGRPVPSRVADLDELRALLVPVHDSGQGGRGPAPRRRHRQRRALRPAARRRSALHLDGAAHGEGLPVSREGDRRARRGAARKGWRSGPRCRAGRSSSR